MPFSLVRWTTQILKAISKQGNSSEIDFNNPLKIHSSYQASMSRNTKPTVIRVGLVQYETHTDQGWPSQCKALIYKQEAREERKMEGVLPYMHKALTRRYGHALKPPYQNIRTAESSKILNMEGHCSDLEGRKYVESNSYYLSSDLSGFSHDLPAIPSLHERRLSRTAPEEYKDVMSLNVKLSNRWAISCSFSPPNQEAAKKKESNRQR